MNAPSINGGSALPTDRAEVGLVALEARLRHDLACLDYPAKPWVLQRSHPSGRPVRDVVIVGGGQSGLAAAFALTRQKVENLLVIDENPEGQEGPWITYARMATLRTPKYLTGPDLGIPSLTFRAWWEAQYGPEGWEQLGKVPRQDWMRYLAWYRRVLGLPVRNGVRLEGIAPLEGGLFELRVSGDGADAAGAVDGTLLARKVVLATGIQGGGEWHVPPLVRDRLPRLLYAHTSERIDFAGLAGRRIGIQGGGASAFDNAQFALGAGVGGVDVFLRKGELPRINPIRYMENAGFLGHFADLGDAAKYRAMAYFLDHAQPPTNDMFARAASYPNFRLHLSAPWQDLAPDGDGVRVTTPAGDFRFDFLVISTGFVTDLTLRPELAALAPDIALWRDRYTPPPGAAHPLLEVHPYLGPGFELQPRTPEAAARLHGIFAFNYCALASLGLSASALSGMKFALPRLTGAITRQLFTDDQDAILGDFMAYREEEFTGRWPAD